MNITRNYTLIRYSNNKINYPKGENRYISRWQSPIYHNNNRTIVNKSDSHKRIVSHYVGVVRYYSQLFLQSRQVQGKCPRKCSE